MLTQACKAGQRFAEHLPARKCVHQVQHGRTLLHCIRAQTVPDESVQAHSISTGRSLLIFLKVKRTKKLAKDIKQLIQGVNNSGVLGADKMKPRHLKPYANGKLPIVQDPTLYIPLTAPQQWIPDEHVPKLRAALKSKLKGFQLQHGVILGPKLSARPNQKRDGTFLSVDMDEKSIPEFDLLLTVLDKVMVEHNLKGYKEHYTGPLELHASIGWAQGDHRESLGLLLQSNISFSLMHKVEPKETKVVLRTGWKDAVVWP